MTTLNDLFEQELGVLAEMHDGLVSLFQEQRQNNPVRDSGKAYCLLSVFYQNGLPHAEEYAGASPREVVRKAQASVRKENVGYPVILWDRSSNHGRVCYDTVSDPEATQVLPAYRS